MKKHIYDFLYSTNAGLVNSKSLLYIEIIYLCWQTGCNAYLKHKIIILFKIAKAKSGIPEHIKWKEEHMNI